MSEWHNVSLERDDPLPPSSPISFHSDISILSDQSSFKKELLAILDEIEKILAEHEVLGGVFSARESDCVKEMSQRKDRPVGEKKEGTWYVQRTKSDGSPMETPREVMDKDQIALFDSMFPGKQRGVIHLQITDN